LNQPKASSPAPASDPASEPTPTILTPEQTEAETHRAAFLNKEVSQLEASKLVSDEAELLEIEARVDVLKERIARTIFTGAFSCYIADTHIHSRLPRMKTSPIPYRSLPNFQPLGRVLYRPSSS